MSNLPVIVGFGGVNAAGRGSFHHAYRRMVIDSLKPADSNETYLDLATMMGLLFYQEGHFVGKDGRQCTAEQVEKRFGGTIRSNTLLRKIGKDLIDVDRVDIKKKLQLKPGPDNAVRLVSLKNQLPSVIPHNWKIEEINDHEVEITVDTELDFFIEDRKKMTVQSGGQLPTGYDPGTSYASKNHPRGLQLVVNAASDAFQSMGIDWDVIRDIVPPDQIGVYAGAAMGQLDGCGGGGFLSAPHHGKRPSSKQLPLSLVEMAADFINAYQIGNVGYTGAQVGACATTLYNFTSAVTDIQIGKRRVAVVGNAEAPLVPEVIEGYRAMSALAEDAQILKLDEANNATTPDYSRSCRPFGYNCGFTLGESAQFFILCDDELAMELGAQIHGAIGGIFINADGFKKSIASPGFGNYLTIAKALGLARSIFGIDRVRTRSFIQSHGTGTPQNRTTESHGMNEVAKSFGIENWPVAAIKCYVGHSLGPAAGDQLAAALGTWKYGLIPGIFTLDRIPEDVHRSNLKFSQKHLEVGVDQMDMAFINSKGFGGNNATGTIISPHYTRDMLKKKHGEKSFKEYQKKNESVAEKAEAYDREATKGLATPIYIFGKNVLDGDDLNMDDKKVAVPGFKKAVNLEIPTPYPDMTVK